MAVNITAIDGVFGEESSTFVEIFYIAHCKSKFLYSSFVLTVLLFLLSRTNQKLVRNEKKQKIPIVSWFPGKISFLDGLYTPFKLRNDGVKMLEDMVSKYGSVFEVPFGTIKVIGVTDTSVIKKVLSSANPDHLNKPKYIYDKLFENVLGQGLIVTDHRTWRVHRSVAHKAFSYRNFQSYLKIMNRHGEQLATKLHNKRVECLEQVQVGIREVNKLIDFHALGIVAESLYGPMYYSDDINENIQRNIHRAKEITLYRFLHPELFIEFLWKLHPKKWELDRLWIKFTEALKEIVEAYNVRILRQDSQNLRSKFCSPVYGNSENDMGKDIDKCVHVTDEEDDGLEVKPPRYMIEEMIRYGMTNEEIYSEIATFLIAGFETTVVSFNLLLFHLALNPDVQAKCHKELDTLMDAKGVNRDSDLNIEFTMEDLVKLKYMERCIYESMRLTTPVPVFSRRLDTNLKVNDELEFEAGQVILLLPWVLHRDSRHFPSPLEFNPDRFLPKNSKGRQQHAFIPLSGGLRGCIGRKFAIMMIKILLARILRDFEIHTEDRFDDIKFFLEATLRPEREIRMSLKMRDEAHHAKFKNS